MAVTAAVDRCLGDLFRFEDVGVVAVVVGDGTSPRTAALLAMRTKWRRVISVDPALHTMATGATHDDDGEGADGGEQEPVEPGPKMPREQRHEGHAQQLASAWDGRQEQLAALKRIR